MSAPIATSDIARQAFIDLELGPIASFDDGGEYPELARGGLQPAIRLCLEQGDWGFASRLASLPETTPDIADAALAHAYALPADLVRIQRVGEEGCEPEWRIDETLIRADQTAPLIIRYTRLITTEARMPQLFRRAAAARLAADMAPHILKSQSRSERLARDAKAYLDEAKRALARTASGRRHDGRDRRENWAEAAAR